jgi:chitinase
LTVLQVQDYNSGPITGLDGAYHTMGGADFHIAMLDMLLAGFPVAGTGKTFPALRADQVALGIPATGSAGNGYVAPATVQQALDYIIKGTPTGSYVKRSTNATNFRGVMTWSINWDAFNGIYEFSNFYRNYMNSLP